MRNIFGWVFVLAALTLAPNTGAVPSQGAPRNVVPRNTVQPEVVEPVTPSFDHSVFNALLRANVRNGLVDYAAFRDNADFARYLAALKVAKLDGFEEADRIAFWLNVYNAYTIQLVASRGETESIRNIDKALGLFRLKGPWSSPFVEAAGRTLTLDDVEHRILRQDFSEPRVHFAMCFGARGGPPLRNEAYTGPLLEEQLESQAHAFLHDSTKNRVDTARRIVHVSPVIARHRSDLAKRRRPWADSWRTIIRTDLNAGFSCPPSGHPCRWL